MQAGNWLLPALPEDGFDVASSCYRGDSARLQRKESSGSLTQPEQFQLEQAVSDTTNHGESSSNPNPHMQGSRMNRNRAEEAKSSVFLGGGGQQIWARFANAFFLLLSHMWMVGVPGMILKSRESLSVAQHINFISPQSGREVSGNSGSLQNSTQDPGPGMLGKFYILGTLCW